MSLLLTPVPEASQKEPWLGLASYSESDSELFFGRDQERLELLRRIRREVLTILFGPSGTGKTSLLNAGLFPRLRESGFLPLAIRLDHTGDRPDYVRQIREFIERALHSDSAHSLEEVALAPPQVPLRDETLWEYLHRVVFWDWRNNPVTPVLVIDQFEEIFTLGRNRTSTEEFLAALADLVENYIPSSVRSRLEAPGETIAFPHDKPKCKVVLSLREDFVWRLDGLRKAMPSVMYNRFAIARMNGEQALVAVREPGRGIVDEGVSFQIVRFLAAVNATRLAAQEAPDLENSQVDPALLSVVCRELNRLRIDRGKDRITGDLIEQTGTDILHEFYERGFVGLNPPIRCFVEDRLLTASGFRSTVPLEEAIQAGVSVQDVGILVDRRLIRTEERLGIPHLELTHDLLTKVVQKSRTERQERERRERQEQSRRAELRRARRLVASISTGSLIALGVFGFLLLKNQRLLRETVAERLASQAALLQQQKHAALPESVLLALESMRHSPTLFSDDLARRGLALLPKQHWQVDHKGDVNAVMFSPDGKYVASADEAMARIIEVNTGKELTRLEHKQRVLSVAFSPDGRYLATGSEDGTARILNVAPGGKEICRLKHGGDVNVVAFSPIAALVATGSYDNTARTMDAATCKEIGRLAHQKRVVSVAFSPDGKRVITGSFDHTARLMNATTGKELWRWEHSGNIYAVAFSPNGRYVAAASADGASVAHADTGRRISGLPHEGPVGAK